jgi:hypothetical protein
MSNNKIEGVDVVGRRERLAKTTKSCDMSNEQLRSCMLNLKRELCSRCLLSLALDVQSEEKEAGEVHYCGSDSFVGCDKASPSPSDNGVDGSGTGEGNNGKYINIIIH